MATYWKSQDRKYCEFCKCWFADNKVSIQFHENGKRHKENVKKHISQLSKRSAKEFKRKEKLEDDIKKMEAAGMSAYLKDVQNNADLTSHSINELLGQDGRTSKDIVVTTNIINMKETPAWQEVRNEDGGSYFWNTQTNETTWDPPDTYVSIADQEKKKSGDKDEQKRQKKIKKQKEKEATMEAKAHLARESMRELAVKKDNPPPVYVPFGPTPCQKPYGSWKAVIKQPEESIDLQLPKKNGEKEVIPPPVVVEPETIEFKEKRVQSLGDGPVEFKKRRFNNPKRNTRQKIDDD